MKIDNVYFAQLRIVSDVKYIPGEMFFDGEKTVHTKVLKLVLVKTKINRDGKLIAKDLNTNKKYLCEIPFEIGKVFIDASNLFSFQEHVSDETNMPKKKVLKIGKEVISACYKERQSNKEE